MLKKEVKDILAKHEKYGWVTEPDALQIFSLYGFRTPRFDVATDVAQAAAIAKEIGYPVVAKIVSHDVVHKSDVKGVVVGIKDDKTLEEAFRHISRIEGFDGMLIAEMVKGLELIIGAKNDLQFGPMILLGMGGVGVEIYKDVSLRMAPLTGRDVEGMIDGLVAGKLLSGYRGGASVNMDELKKTLIGFSGLMMDMRHLVESIDLNPVMCTEKVCTIADARIMLKKAG
ncbi:MAG: acetyl-CoA synthetase [Smithella sp.]|jgi:succinyl-CoA synthetase beta subunit|nr:acetyl-CoA synthetase [Smithella sp.]